MNRGFRGSIKVLLLLCGTSFIFFAIYFLINFQNRPKPESENLPVKRTNEPDSYKSDSYKNNEFEFEFKYKKDEFQIKEDNEEQFNKRGKGDFRKNFTYYVGYEPPKVLGAVSVLDKDSSFEKSPFTVWIFENKNNLDIISWYTNFWYYPFLWGDFDNTKGSVQPGETVLIAGQTAKYTVVNYSPGKPKFIYISKGG